MALPPALVGSLRAALSTQGFPPDVVDDAGNLNVGALASAAYETIEFRSSITPDLVVKTRDALSSEPGLARYIRPMVTFRGPAGTVVIAPNGKPWNGGWFAAAGIVFGLVGVGYLLGVSKRR